MFPVSGYPLDDLEIPRFIIKCLKYDSIAGQICRPDDNLSAECACSHARIHVSAKDEMHTLRGPVETGTYLLVTISKPRNKLHGT